ncbi:2-succinyl-5-enolpyruvyl-6-hydroxy-3-cyclohexene-1-carboxylic-acid synthase [Pontiellaceae bacterium B12227]|nr:2-succinyl-5-enolpyruvyl-6-hydroxy-3-cyclohexene-1-carboxylic-acid synthase [Pontiellaceae bacterium B12227]
MYSIIESVRILVKLLKEYGVRHIVVSPGGSSVPIVHSLEADKYFTCYSVVDERSAAYFAMGVSQQLGEPVAAVCTSGTAACNYLPAVTEAFYQNVPLVLITADKHPYYNHQLVHQVINQQNIYQDKCKHSVSLPIEIKTDDDAWYCRRLINEALLDTSRHGAGPVHINIPTIGSQQNYSVKELPDLKAINLLSYGSDVELWQGKIEELVEAKEILVVFGQHCPYSEETVRYIEMFAEKYNCFLSVEHVSNLKCKGALPTYPVLETDARHAAKTAPPDLLISLGGNSATYQMRNFTSTVTKPFKHWVIEESGYVKDPFKHLTDIFECTPAYFFEFFAKNAPEGAVNDQAYYTKWSELADNFNLTELPYSNFYAAQGLAANIPDNSLLHLSILSSTRHMQFFELDKSIRVYSNIGALGIDGSMSSFMGQAAVSDNLAFLMIGDLSFFYDMNSIGLKHVSKNVRILLVNNRGASEFHFYIGKQNIASLDDYVSVRHGSTAKGWVESCGFRYLSAETKEEFDSSIVDFVSEDSDAPVLFEVFTDMEEDAKITRELFDLNEEDDGGAEKRKVLKKMATTVLGDQNAKKVAKAITAARNSR